MHLKNARCSSNRARSPSFPFVRDWTGIVWEYLEENVETTIPDWNKSVISRFSIHSQFTQILPLNKKITSWKNDKYVQTPVFLWLSVFGVKYKCYIWLNFNGKTFNSLNLSEKIKTKRQKCMLTDVTTSEEFFQLKPVCLCIIITMFFWTSDWF